MKTQTVVTWRRLVKTCCTGAILAWTALTLCSSSALAANRIFTLNVRNNGDTPLTVTLNAGQCYEGNVANGTVTKLEARKNQWQLPISIARVQGNGCDGENGNFTLTFDPPVQGKKTVSFSFDNDGSLWLDQSATRYPGWLSKKNPKDESYIYCTTGQIVTWDGSTPLEDGQTIVIKTAIRHKDIYGSGGQTEAFGPLYLAPESVSGVDYIIAKDVEPTSANYFKVKVIPRGPKQFIAETPDFQNIILTASNGKCIDLRGGLQVTATKDPKDDPIILILDLTRKSILYWSGLKVNHIPDEKETTVHGFGAHLDSGKNGTGKNFLQKCDGAYGDASFMTIELVRAMN